MKRRRLITLLIIFIILLIFVVLNKDSKTTISLGVRPIENVSLLLSLAIAFVLGFGTAVVVAKTPVSKSLPSSPQNDTPKQKVERRATSKGKSEKVSQKEADQE